jgi:mono/diheme cytochrome c family protein
VALLAIAAPGAAQDEPTVSAGRKLYMRYCASCHGQDARGNGPVAAALKTPPADLTGIRARHGDRWPYTLLRDIIDGRPPRAHGPREMPIWGQKLGEGKGLGKELHVSNAITVLLAYLKTLQVPQADGSK